MGEKQYIGEEAFSVGQIPFADEKEMICQSGV